MKGIEDMSPLIDKFKSPLGIYLSIITVGLIAHYAKIEWLEEFYDALDVAAAVALALLALWGYIEYSRGEDSISIYFDVEGEVQNTYLSLLRKNFTRAELLGLLGMLQKDPTKRFVITSTKKPDFQKRIQDIQTGKDKEFMIYMEKKDREQFLLQDEESND